MSIISGTAKSAGGFYDYPIENSLRFVGSSYLSRTPTTASNRKTWTWSGWVKRSSISSSADQQLFSVRQGTPVTNLAITTADQLTVFIRNSSSTTVGSVTSLAKFRDISSWYHIVLKVDTTASTTIELYVNGNLISDFNSTPTYPSGSFETEVNNSAAEHRIGNQPVYNTDYFNGYLANIQFIDGQALDPYFFGESKNGVWIPYNAFSTAGSGTATASDGDTATDSYGTNGFHLTFEDGIESLSVEGYTGSVNAFRDKSGNNKHWKIN